MDTARLVALSSDANRLHARLLNSGVTRAKERIELYTDKANAALASLKDTSGEKSSAHEARRLEIERAESLQRHEDEKRREQEAERAQKMRERHQLQDALLSRNTSFFEKLSQRIGEAARDLKQASAVKDEGRGGRYELTPEQKALVAKEKTDIAASRVAEQQQQQLNQQKEMER